MPFSKRELQVLHLLAKGKTNEEIAKDLTLSPHTVKSYKSRISFKLKGTGVQIDKLKGVSPEVFAQMEKLVDEKGKK